MAADAGDQLVAEAFKALGHPIRVRLLREIAEHQLCVSALQEGLEQTQSNVSQHLSVLRRCRLVVPERLGNRTCYHLAGDWVAEVLRIAAEGLGVKLDPLPAVARARARVAGARR